MGSATTMQTQRDSVMPKSGEADQHTSATVREAVRDRTMRRALDPDP